MLSLARYLHSGEVVSEIRSTADAATATVTTEYPSPSLPSVHNLLSTPRRLRAQTSPEKTTVARFPPTFMANM